ncbi:aspartyl/asparaginyl beta-hydroxylase domain-containing protein [Candidatus Cyanaurora vandensis]|uniref:aspartyl/asparaginyl beta-hydroxylase domain-containing protein n=1 Tax=Candidatus Cyanaurora vandensis TaxID=2714958 RepID=UPI00257AE1AA|nr:aspartyl/asparaginyl beta-hydroxylase domain-containing protein [Candidatus Cyanaurora vandensis]
MTKKSTLWYSFQGSKYEGEEPSFYDTATLPWVAELEANWTVIAAELETLLIEQEDSLIPYPSHVLASVPSQWRTIAFSFWGLQNTENCKRCPQTFALLKKIPYMVSGIFSLLEPGTTVKPHRGDTNATIRCHLGLSIPSEDTALCGIKVGSKVQPWAEGKVMAFCDAHLHTAWNHSPSRRFVLIIDVMQPTYANQMGRVCCQVMASIYLATAYQRSEFLRRYLRGKNIRFLFQKGLGLLARLSKALGQSELPAYSKVIKA